MILKILAKLLLKGKRAYVRPITLNGTTYYLTVSTRLSAEDGMAYARKVLGPELF